MKIQDLLNLIPKEVSHDFYAIKDVLPHIHTKDGESSAFSQKFSNIDVSHEVHEEIENEKRISQNTYMREGDDKYGAHLFTVCFDNTPIMVVKNDGRYFQDYEVFVINESAFNDFEKYLDQKISVNNRPQFSDVQEDIEDLDVVNNYKLSDHYNANLQLSYKVGDVVWAWVPENHLKYSSSPNYKGFVLTRCKIERINQFDPNKTYTTHQLDRAWKNHEMVFQQDAGSIYAHFSESSILAKVDSIAIPNQAINHFVNEQGHLQSDYKCEDFSTYLNKTSNKAKMK